MTKLDVKVAESHLIAYASTMPQAWEDHPWDHTVLKVGKKIFVFFGGAAAPEGVLSVTVKLPVSYEMALTLPYMRPAGHGLWKGGWAQLTQSSGDDIELDTIKGWIVQSYRAVAPKKLARLIDQQGLTGDPARARLPAMVEARRP